MHLLARTAVQEADAIPPAERPAAETRGLTPKQARFVAEYLIDLNAKQAAIRAGYSPKGAETQGSLLLRIPKLAAAIGNGKSRQLAAADLSAARVLEELRRVAFSNIGSLFDDQWELLPLHTLTEESVAALAAIEVFQKGDTGTVVKVKLWDKVRALEMLAKHFSLLRDVVRVEDDAKNIALLYAGRARAAAAKAARETAAPKA